MSYNANIPQATDLISQSQGQLLNNFSQANIAFGVDHTAFDVAANQGKHKKATLIKQTVDPAADAAGPLIYSRDVVYPSGPTTKTEELLRQSSVDGSTVIALTSLFNLPITAASGSSFLPGIPTVVGPNLTTGAAVIKWGIFSTVSLAATGSQTFASPFPTACFAVILTPISKPGGTSNNGTLAPINGTVAVGGFDWSFSTGPTASYLGFYYIAIGN